MAGIALAMGLTVGFAGAAFAFDEPVPNTAAGHAVAVRHANYHQLGGAFKALNDELKKDTPDKAVVSANAQKMAALADQLPTWFPKGSGPESGAKTGAKPNIWTDPAGFAAAARMLQVETAKLQQVAMTGDMAAVRAQVRATGGACKNCHDKYRLSEH